MGWGSGSHSTERQPLLANKKYTHHTADFIKRFAFRVQTVAWADVFGAPFLLKAPFAFRDSVVIMHCLVHFALKYATKIIFIEKYKLSTTVVTLEAFALNG